MTDLEKVTLNAKLDYEGGLETFISYGTPNNLMKKYPEFAKLIEDFRKSHEALENYLATDASEEDFDENEFNNTYSSNWK